MARVEHAVAARDEERRLGERHLAVRQVHTRQVTLQVVDADDGDAPPQPSALAVAIPTSSAPTRPGPDVTATASSSGPPTPASSAPRHDRRDRLCVRPARQFGHHPAEGGVQVHLARHDRRAHVSVSSTTAAAVSSHDVSTASRAASPAAEYALDLRPRDRALALDAASGPPTLTSVEGTSCSSPPSTIRSTERPRLAATSPRRTRRGRAVRVGARHDEHARLVQQRPQEVVVGDPHRHLGPTGQPRRPAAPGREAEGQSERSRPPAAGQRLAPGVKATPSARTCSIDAASTGKVHALWPVLHPVDRPAPRRRRRARRQPVDGVGRDDDDAAGSEPLSPPRARLRCRRARPHRLASLSFGGATLGRPLRASAGGWRHRRASGPTASRRRVRRRRARSRCRRGRGCRGCG